MKDNYITLKDEFGIKKEYRILFKIESEDNLNYLVYTDDEKNKNGKLNVYASSYEMSEKGNMTKFKRVNSKEEFDFIENILSSLEEKCDEEGF